MFFYFFAYCRRFSGFIANFEHTSRLFLSASIVNFEQVSAHCVRG